jgi:hypothetical protein
MFLNIQVTEVEQVWSVVIEGQSRTSFTRCNTRGEAEDLASIARKNPTVAEKLHGCRD